MKTNTNLLARENDLNFIGWKSYKQIKKKAMEQEFSWSGLSLSLSIAFLVVITSAYILNFFYNSIEDARKHEYFLNQKIYHLESSEHINQQSSTLKRLLGIKTALAASTEDYLAEVDEWTINLKMEAGETSEYIIKIKNIGKETWPKDKVFLEKGPFLRGISILRHESWLKYYRPIGLETDIAPGETASLTLRFQAPDDIDGRIQENYYLVVNNYFIPGSEVRIFIDLKSIEMLDDNIAVENTLIDNQVNEAEKDEQIDTSEASLDSQADFCIALSSEEREQYEKCRTNPNENDNTSGISENIKLEAEPILRIGLFTTDKAERITSEDYFDVYGGDRLLMSGLPAGFMAAISYNSSNNKYTVSTKSLTKFSFVPIRFIPRNKNSVMTLLDFDSRPKWNTSLNDNKFRNIIEFNYSLETRKLWVINELPMSCYLKGLAETTNYSPVDYQKAIAVAARTYAMYHYNRGIEYDIADGSTKHAKEHFHLDSVWDQVYRGYNAESRLSRMSEAVNATKGVVITYDEKIVVTPYFSQSDGRTRGWEEVWYGNAKPWLESVSVPEDKGKDLWGHGVGMSARGALIMIRDKAKGWIDTLKYFYRGTDLEKIYN